MIDESEIVDHALCCGTVLPRFDGELLSCSQAALPNWIGLLNPPMYLAAVKKPVVDEATVMERVMGIEPTS